MSKLHNVIDRDGKVIGYSFYCPGCEHMHWYEVPRWTFNGDKGKPSFTPSLLQRSEYGPERRPRVCHLFLTEGRLHFCGDCTHGLAGQTVDLPDIDGGPQ